MREKNRYGVVNFEVVCHSNDAMALMMITVIMIKNRVVFNM